MDQQNQTFDNIRQESKRLIIQSEKESLDSDKSADFHDQNYSQPDKKTNPEKTIDNFNISNENLRPSSSYSIDENIQKMRLELKKCSQLFESAGEAFESINFNGLKHRIRDLHLSANHAEIETVMQEKEVDQKLSKLTEIMGHKFRQHPGEFGDIPELSNFFKACSQLQHGLDQLKHQRFEMDGLGKQITSATNASRLRIEEIQKTLKK
ncbi:uncharacterized protein LOC129939633 [Eupeodes corollae]|uniref:uncharacterized protein LOC129939633 n=1 Tax=Eupeodes corollae TaxID=290404 RepID=UPI002491459A|nr:uncharacterized protein LOC129939633 [Eupeodes corollae]